MNVGDLSAREGSAGIPDGEKYDAVFCYFNEVAVHGSPVTRVFVNEVGDLPLGEERGIREILVVEVPSLNRLNGRGRVDGARIGIVVDNRERSLLLPAVCGGKLARHEVETVSGLADLGYLTCRELSAGVPNREHGVILAVLLGEADKPAVFLCPVALVRVEKLFHIVRFRSFGGGFFGCGRRGRRRRDLRRLGGVLRGSCRRRFRRKIEKRPEIAGGEHKRHRNQRQNCNQFFHGSFPFCYSLSFVTNQFV